MEKENIQKETRRSASPPILYLCFSILIRFNSWKEQISPNNLMNVWLAFLLLAVYITGICIKNTIKHYQECWGKNRKAQLVGDLFFVILSIFTYLVYYDPFSQI